MDDPALQRRLRRIERRQYIVLALLVVPYFYWLADVVGFYVAGVLGTVAAVLGFAAVAINRRGDRDTADQ